jgi:hypothetical protein
LRLTDETRDRMTHARTIEVKEFNASSAPPVTRVESRHPSTRNWSRLLGLVGTLSLHGLAVQSLVLASVPHKPRPPELQGAGAHRVESVPPAEELVLVTLDGVHKGEDADLLEQIVSLAPRLENPQFSALEADTPASIDVASTEVSAEGSSQASPDADEPALRALMFGRYTDQIRARIERAWIRPRTAVDDATIPRRSSAGTDSAIPYDNKTFTCRVQIRQGVRGDVQEVLLLQCNGTEAWRHSLVIAINQASPLPAPPTMKVFKRALTMSFDAPAYRPEIGSDGYELEPRQLVDSHSPNESNQGVE